ncbi:MAG: glycosyltransferase [Lachnospiraceae bacterium]|nr:glycosyltransferase [Lachnospiraceae bacterium]
MISEKNQPVLLQIIELLDTACEACGELRQALSGENTETAQTLLDDLRFVTESVTAAQEPLLPELTHAYTKETLANLADTLESVRRSLNGGDVPRALQYVDCQLHPFFLQLRASFSFFGLVYPDEEKMRVYYREEFAAQCRNPFLFSGEKPKYRLSVIVPAYNHLETTKRCIEQIRKETDFKELHAELTLIDHGSTDGTYEYFESIGADKVIRFKENNRMFVFSTMAQVAEGEYFVFVSSDVLVTKDWAKLLLSCMESDPSIIMAVPKTANTSNLQAVETPVLTAEEFLQWADTHNRHDPSLWEDRARLMPALAMYRTAAVHEIGFADPVFYSMEFWDDDFSLRARRAGYRQVLCGDVACYHYGSVTGGEAQREEGTLEYGRKLFIQKHGVDAWSQGAYYDPDVMSLFRQLRFAEEHPSFLGIDAGMGDTLLQMRNECRKQGQDARLYHLTAQKQYLPDLEPLADETVYDADLIHGTGQAFRGISFSCIFIGRDISCYESPGELIRTLADRLSPDGRLILSCDNPFFARRLYALLQFSLPEDGERYSCAVPMQVHGWLEKLFANVDITVQTETVDGLEDFITQHYGKGVLPERFREELSVKRYLFLCGGVKHHG